jgi:hypothetical protein
VDALNVILSLMSGAGGALILDLWWKPRYARKRSAVLLRAEIQKNRDLLEDRLPFGGDRVRIWRDFMLPRIALDATIGDLGHFPVALAEATIWLYHDYAKILRAYELQVEAFNDTIGPGEPDERTKENFRVCRTVLLQLMTRGVKASDEMIEQLDTELARSLWPGRRPRLLAPKGEPRDTIRGREQEGTRTIRGQTDEQNL